MANLAPPFTADSAQKKVKGIQNLWNEQNADKSAAMYVSDATVENAGAVLNGNEQILNFLKKKFTNEKDYTLRKELFSFENNKIAAQYWNEFRDGAEAANGKTVWKRTYGLEHWTFAEDGRMTKGLMAQKEVVIQESERWFKDGAHPDSITIPK